MKKIINDLEYENSLLERIMKHDGKWRHKNERLYKVLYIANTKANKTSLNTEYPLTVVYTDDNNNIWAKSPKMFLANRIEEPPKDSKNSLN